MSELKVNKISPQSGTAFTLGDSGDTFTVPSGATLTVAGTLTQTGAQTFDGGVDIDNFNINGSEIDLSSGDLTVDVAGDIILDADGGEILFHDATTAMGHISMASSNITLKSLVSDKDIIFQGNDGGSGITALTLDMSAAGAATFNDKIIATELDISGNCDIDGTTNLDAVDIDGAVQLDATLTIGADDQGYDVILYGDTASANVTWDTSADDLIFNGAAGLIVPDGQLTLGSTAITTTAAEINLIDGGTARGTTAIADGDGVLINDAGTMRMTTVQTLKTYTAHTPIAAEMDRGDNTQQTISNNTGTTVVFSRERFDLGGCADPSNNKFVIPSGEGGKYFFYFRIGYSNPNTTGHRIMYLRRANSGGSFGALKEFQDNGAMFGAAAATGWVGSAIMDMDEGQEADLQIYQGSGGNLLTNPVSGQNLFFGMFKLPGTS